jgi:hypothetical protein
MRFFSQNPFSNKTKNLLTDRGLQKRQKMETKVIEIEYQDEEDKAEEEAEKEDDEEGDDADKDDEKEEDDAEKQQQQQQPPRTVTKIRGGQMREYNFLKSVNSVAELDKLRFKVIKKRRNNKIIEN